MILDIAIILSYFVGIMVVGIFSRTKDVTSEEYFLSSRKLGWASIAISTIATNIAAGHFLGMSGSAYLYGLGQANLEINAILGILIAVFFFVPLYLQLKVVTITQFFENKFGPKIALCYSIFMIVLYAFIYLGSTLFWAAYAVNAMFRDAVEFISNDPATRICVIIVLLGVFSAIYTYLGGLTAVVRTDIIQFILLLGGGLIVAYLSITKAGGWDALYSKTIGVSKYAPNTHLMHLHWSYDHPTFPWLALIGMNLLNLNYWGANQVILQRALAARSLKDAQIGLLVGGIFKYLMALIVVVPGIALAAILGKEVRLTDPDQVYPMLLKILIPSGLRGLILCGLFASLMSTVDSIFNSVSTLWSIDIYKKYINPKASDRKVVESGKKAIIMALFTGILFAFIQVYVKYHKYKIMELPIKYEKSLNNNKVSSELKNIFEKFKYPISSEDIQIIKKDRGVWIINDKTLYICEKLPNFKKIIYSFPLKENLLKEGGKISEEILEKFKNKGININKDTILEKYKKGFWCIGEYFIFQHNRKAYIYPAIINVYVRPKIALTHWFNEVSYIIKNGFVLLILAAVFLISPSRNLVFYTFILSIILTGSLRYFFHQPYLKPKYKGEISIEFKKDLNNHKISQKLFNALKNKGVKIDPQETIKIEEKDWKWRIGRYKIVLEDKKLKIYDAPIWMIILDNYFNRSTLVILLTFLIVAIPTIIKNGWKIPVKKLIYSANISVSIFGGLLFISLISCHIYFH